MTTTTEQAFIEALNTKSPVLIGVFAPQGVNSIEWANMIMKLHEEPTPKGQLEERLDELAAELVRERDLTDRLRKERDYFKSRVVCDAPEESDEVRCLRDEIRDLKNEIVRLRGEQVALDLLELSK